MARDRGLVVTCPMLLTLALEEAKKKGIARSLLSFWGVSQTVKQRQRHRQKGTVRRSSQQSTPSSSSSSPMYSTCKLWNGTVLLSVFQPLSEYAWRRCPRRKAVTKTASPSSNGFLDGREGETFDDQMEEWEPACPKWGRQFLEQTPGDVPQPRKSLYDHPTVLRV